MTSWQKVILIMAAMILAVLCSASKTCGEHSESVMHLAYVIVGAVFGLTVPGKDGPQSPPKA